ncbi:MAG: ROK family glucokinase [Clostridia bacterium]|nr:ROK family glucokinase [Clostridia bacterium]
MFIGVDLGGTNIVVGLVNTEGELMESLSLPTGRERGFEAVTQDIIKLARQLMTSDVAKTDPVQGVGIGIPGIADPETGVVISCVNLFWENVPLRSVLEAGLSLPVFIDNDATLAGLAEYELGVMKGVKSGVFLTLGTGVGGGVIMDHQVISGKHGIGSEVGHMVVGDSDVRCNCGRKGCLETFASSTAIIAYAKKHLSDHPESILHEKIEGNLDKIDGRLIFDAAKAGDDFAMQAVRRFAHYLAIGIINIVAVIDPEMFVLGGGIAGAGEFLLEIVKEEMEKEKYFRSVPVGKLCLAKLKNDAGVLGGAFLAKSRLKEQ